MMGAPRAARAMWPRPQKGESVVAGLRLSATDEGVWIARLAFRDPSQNGRLLVQYATRDLWDADYPVETFAHHIGGATMDIVEWTVS